MPKRPSRSVAAASLVTTPGTPQRPCAGPDSPYAGLCPEAQADGVPCQESGRDCEICGRAVRVVPPAPLSADPTAW